MTEKDLYIPVKQYFEQQGFEIFPEVQIYRQGKVTDVVAIRNKIVAAVELKLNLNLTVMEQAYNNRNNANYTYIAVNRPENRVVKSRNDNYRYDNKHSRAFFAINICRMLGIGVLFVKYYNLSEVPDSILVLMGTEFERRNIKVFTKTLREKYNWDGVMLFIDKERQKDFSIETLDMDEAKRILKQIIDKEK